MVVKVDCIFSEYHSNLYVSHYYVLLMYITRNGDFKGEAI